MKGRVWGLVASGILLAGCASKYQAWDGVRGYRESPAAQGYVVQVVGDKFVRWSILEAQLVRRCTELSHAAAWPRAMVGPMRREWNTDLQDDVLGVNRYQGVPAGTDGFAQSTLTLTLPASTLVKMKQATADCTPHEA